ncbi:MAG TPA: pseudouridine synthase [bacterium]|nr:pseudouridine synthase [bacterium]
MTDKKIRINRFIAQSGIASRRKAEELINEGRVTINGRKAILSDTVDADNDVVEFDGKKIQSADKLEYYLLYKPAGILSTSSDDRGRKTVSDLLPEGSKAVPVGRLDLDTTGVLILTTDGELHYRLTHPSFNIKKIYKATIAGEFTEEKAKKITAGIEIDGIIMRAEKLVILNRRGETVTDITIVLNEGRKREIKELVRAVGCRVIQLERVAFANITCNEMNKGEIRPLTDTEISSLYKLTGLKK